MVALGVVASCLVLPGTVDAQWRQGVTAESFPQVTRLALKRARYAVVVGDMRDSTSYRGADLGPRLEAGVERTLRDMRRVIVLRASDANAAILEHLERRSIPTLRVEGSVTAVERGKLEGHPSVRCQVSLLVRDERGGSIRSILRGAATFAESQRGPKRVRDRRLTTAALDRAVHSALRGVSRVLDGSARHAKAAMPADRRLALRR